MIELIDLSAYAAALADPRFLAGVVVAIISGLVRGFTGFGSALIYVPLIAAIYEPRIAAVTLLIVDFAAGLPFAVQQFPKCDWRDVLPVWLGSAIAVPFGTMVLLWVDPITLRWIIAVLVLVLLAVLMSGWRYRGHPVLPVQLGVGALAGLGAGAVQISGPPVIIYWLGSRSGAEVARANMMVFFVLGGAVSCVVFFLHGLLTAEAIRLSVLLGVPYLAAMGIGASFFKGASEMAYRRAAYVIVALAALVSMPLFDQFLR